MSFKLVLASSSPHRLKLLENISLMPDQIISADIDERPLAKEKSIELAKRLSQEKAKKIAQNYSGNAFIIAADTVVGTKAKSFDKALTTEDVAKYIDFFSGRRIHVYTAVSVIKVEQGNFQKISTRLTDSIIKFKNFSVLEKEHYIKTGHGIGVAGGLAIEGIGETLIQWMKGSYSGIIGLPLYETINLLQGLGYHVYQSKS